MSDEFVTAAIGAAVTLGVGILAAVVAVLVHQAGERSRRREALAEQQRQAVVRMLDTIDEAIRAGLIPRIFRPSRSPELELTMALPRLLMDLPRQDLPVATWAAGQIQQARSRLRRREFVERVVAVEAALISWHRGDLAVSWFEEQLSQTPYDPQFRLRRRTRIFLWTRDMFESALAVASWAVVTAAASGQLWRKRPHR